MQVRFQNSPKETATMSTKETRDNFLIQNLMVQGEISLTYSHYDRIIVGGVVPTSESIALPTSLNRIIRPSVSRIISSLK